MNLWGRTNPPTEEKVRYNMYNMIKNKLSSYIFNSFQKQSYTCISKVDGKEQLYYNDKKLVAVIEDYEVGANVYEVVKSLFENGTKISTDNISFSINKYTVDKYNRVQIIFANVDFEMEWDTFSEAEKLQEMVKFTNSMRSNGYFLDNSKFRNESAIYLSAFLSFFTTTENESTKNSSSIIEYIHYIFSNGGNLKEFYKKIVDGNLIYKISEFPYSFPVVQMCYNYFVDGSTAYDFLDILQKEDFAKKYGSSLSDELLISNPDLTANFAVLEKNELYTVYEENFKIYQNMSDEFYSFFKDNLDGFKSGISHVREDIVSELIGYDGKTIGYQFLLKEFPETQTISEKSFTTPNSIFTFISNVDDFWSRISSYYRIQYINGNNNFNLENSLTCSKVGYNNKFVINTINELYDFVTDDKYLFQKNLIMLFFKLYSKLLTEKYGAMTEERQFLEKPEIRYLSPVVAKEFIAFELKSSDATISVDSFFDFCNTDKRITANDLIYDTRFQYNPEKVPFVFDFEAEEKYGIKIKKDMRVDLPDERTLVTFKGKRNIASLKSQVDKIEEELRRKSPELPNSDDVSFIRFSEIIYSHKVNSDGMYNVIGYVTTPYKGTPITDNLLLKLNNKELLKVAGKIYSHFSTHFIQDQFIFIDKSTYNFYINILDDNIHCCKTYTRTANEFIENKFQDLVEKGYNENAFAGLDITSHFRDIGRYLLNLSNGYDTFCDEHKIYYNSKKKKCPLCLETRYFVSPNYKEAYTLVFEDDIAKHYKTGDGFILKVYKPLERISDVEKCIDSIIIKRINRARSGLVQGCFLPYKKAFDDDFKFIGYVYEEVTFNNPSDNFSCIDLTDSQNMMNLAKVMSLVRLVSQVDDLISTHHAFIMNPFSHVFLNKGWKKQVQILNIEFAKNSVNINTKNTVKWTFEYVQKVIDSDGTLDLDVSSCSSLSRLEDKLQYLANSLTQYCNIHKIYYSKNYLFCPKCVNPAQMKTWNFERISRSTVTSWRQFNEGGESIIYYYKDGGLVKVFRDDEEVKVDYNFKTAIISRILSKRIILEKKNKENHKYKFMIPKKILVDSDTGNLFAYTMDKVENGFPLSNLRDKSQVKDIDFDRKDVLEVLITVGEGIQALHEIGIYIGDLNGRNILFDKNKNVYFLDFDGMGIDEIAPVFCTDGYIDPVSQKSGNITQKDDWYSFAIQVFYYLTFTHPFNGIYEVMENGKKVNLDIPTRMERRISLLGRHNITPPAIAVPWDWMSKELKNSLLNIFEDNRRVSITPELKAQYNMLYGNEYTLPAEPTESKVTTPVTKLRISKKFIAEVSNPFEGNVVRIINADTAICESTTGDYYLAIRMNNSNKQYNIKVAECMKITNVLLSEDMNFAFVIYDYMIAIYDLRTEVCIHSEHFNDTSEAVTVNGNTLYFTGNMNGEYVIQQREISNCVVNSTKIRFLTNSRTKAFLAKFNSKFVLVKENGEKSAEIYCNSQKLCDIEQSSNTAEYHVAYDEATKMWLIINSDGNAITVKSSNGNYKKFIIPDGIKNANVKRICFDKGLIYIPNNDFLYIFNTQNDQLATKKMECCKVMTPESKLCNFNSEGFSVITNYILYNIRKG